MQVRHVRQDVVADEEIRPMPVGTKPRAALRAEKLDHRRDADRFRSTGDVRRRLDPEHRNAALEEVLEEVAVVARDLDHAGALVEAEPCAHLIGVAARVIDPARRIRRKVRVVGEDLLGRGGRRQLDEQAFVADERAERIEPLTAGEVILAEIRVRERRHAEIDEDLLERRVADSTRREDRSHRVPLAQRLGARHSSLSFNRSPARSASSTRRRIRFDVRKSGSSKRMRSSPARNSRTATGRLIRGW